MLPAEVAVVLPKGGRRGEQPLHGPQGRRWQHIVVDPEEGRGGGMEGAERGAREGIGEYSGGEAVGEAQPPKEGIGLRVSTLLLQPQ